MFFEQFVEDFQWAVFIEFEVVHPGRSLCFRLMIEKYTDTVNWLNPESDSGD
jgi:hypothetical protein